MDTSETYIKMCEGAEEIQEPRPQVMIGSVPHYYNGIYQYETDSDGIVRFWNSGGYIWLPRQDQLQEILGYPKCNAIEGFVKFYGLINENMWFIKPELFDYSLEQAWLMYVMKRKYNKVWDGGSWIKDDK